MYKIIQDIIIFIIAVILHELGHIITHYYYQKKFHTILINRWCKITVGTKEQYGENTLRQQSIVAGIGIFVGLDYLLFVTDDLALYFIYIMACFIDIYIIMSFYIAEKHLRDVKVKRIKNVIEPEVVQCSGE
jgi:hypothetical protein